MDPMVRDGAVIAVLVAAVGQLFRMYVKQRDREYEAMVKEKEQERLVTEALKKSYQDIALEAAKTARLVVNRDLAQQHKQPVPVIADVISESHSPSTSQQRENALIATLRSQMALVNIAAGLPPREEPEHAPGSQFVPTAGGEQPSHTPQSRNMESAAGRVEDVADRAEAVADRVESVVEDVKDKLQ